MTTTCLNCGKTLIHTEGRREKKYCGNNCKQAYWQKKKPKDKKTKVLTMEQWEEIQKKLNEKTGRDNQFENAARGRDKSGVNEDEQKSDIDNQIESIRAEKIPKERDTPMGRKSWLIDQQKRIAAL
jgi:predicted  nucleic acid-binding Zn-ribbon protein